MDPHGAEAGVPPSAPPGRRPFIYALAFVMGSALVATFMWVYIGHERRVALEHWKARVTSIADDRARVVSAWLASRRADAEVLAGSPSVRALFAGEAGGRGALQPHLDRVAGVYGYSAILVLDAQGQILARSSAAVDVGPQEAEAARWVVRAGAPRFDLTGAAPDKKILAVTVPVAPRTVEGRRVAAGAVMLRVPAATGLFRLLTDQSVPTRTGETILFGFQGTEPAYLSPLRHDTAGWAATRRSLEQLTVLAQGAANGTESFVEYADYRVIPVLAAVRWITPAGWGLVLKIDRDEALADFYTAERLMVLAAVLLVVALFGLLFSLWRHQQRTDLLRARMQQDRAIFQLKSYAEKILASVPSGILVLSGDLRILSANQSFLEAFYLSQDFVTGRPLSEVVRAKGLEERLRDVLRTGAAQQDLFYEMSLAVRDEHRPVRVSMAGVRIAEDAQARLLLTVQDMSEEERLQAAHRASEQRFRELVQSLDAIVWEADAASLRFTFVSHRAQEILGFPVDRWLGERDFWSARIHPGDQERVATLTRASLARGQDHEFEYRAVTADRRTIWLRDIVHVIRDASGKPTQLRGVTVDVTERKQAEDALRASEEQLRQAQKMEVVGQLAGGIAHDFNNLLMVIQTDSDLIMRRLEPGDPMQRNVEGIVEAAEQAAALTRQLLAFSRKQMLAPRIFDINATVSGMQKMLQRLLGETIDLVTVLAPALPPVKVDPGQVEQVVMNLVINARDAMPDGGTLTLETAAIDLDEVSARLHDDAVPGRYVVLSVSDTGSGMDAETQAKVFEPFFTTKPQGKGTGLGLSTVYGIVKQSGGHIWVYSEIGHGTTFRICLPLAESPVAEDEASLAPAPIAQGAETILLVEDAPRVREVVREILLMGGYTVLEAQHGPDAIEIADRHKGPIHLMLTDVVMPHMSGRELAQRLTPLRPDMKVIYMSGYTDDAIVRHGILHSSTAFLSKPFTPDALAAKVREVLDAAEAGVAAVGPPPAPALDPARNASRIGG